MPQGEDQSRSDLKKIGTLQYLQSLRVVIYALAEPVSRSVRYIGKTVELKRRLKQHWYRKCNKRLHLWLKELKDSGSDPEVLILEQTDLAHWRERERRWIRPYRESGHQLFNIADGGDGIDFLSEAVRRYLSTLHKGRKLSPEHLRAFIAKGQQAAQTPEARAKRSASLRGKPSPLRGKSIHDAVSRQRISIAHTGRPKSNETKAKLSAANLGHKDSAETRAKKSASHMGLPGPNKGRTFGIEVRRKQSAARCGKKRGSEFSTKMSALLSGKPKSPEHRLKMSQRMQGWKPSQQMLAASSAARQKLLQSSEEFRSRSLSGLKLSWNDPEVKRRRAEGNRRRLLPVRKEFERWLDTEPGKRQPPTQAGFQRQHGISEGTITKWKRAILIAKAR
jgi:hypothetical protein